MQLVKILSAVALTITLSVSTGGFSVDRAQAAKKSDKAKCEGPRYKYSEVFKRCERTDDPGF